MLDYFKFIFKGLIESNLVYYVSIVEDRPDKGFINDRKTISW